MKTALVTLTLVMLCVSAFAETYVWVDAEGTTNFADDLGSVPKQYRKKAKILGQEEPAAEASDVKENTDLQQRARENAVAKEVQASPAAGADTKKAVYGGKDAATWKSQLSEANAELKANEKQLVELRNRMKEVTGMSRTEYLSLHNSVKHSEHTVLNLRKKLDDLKQEAASAGVPGEFME